MASGKGLRGEPKRNAVFAPFARNRVCRFGRKPLGAREGEVLSNTGGGSRLMCVRRMAGIMRERDRYPKGRDAVAARGASLEPGPRGAPRRRGHVRYLQRHGEPCVSPSCSQIIPPLQTRSIPSNPRNRSCRTRSMSRRRGGRFRRARRQIRSSSDKRPVAAGGRRFGWRCGRWQSWRLQPGNRGATMPRVTLR